LLSLWIGLPGLLPGSVYQAPVFPYAPAAGQAGSTAVAHDDASLTAWAVAVHAVDYGSDVADEWMQPGNAIGPAGASTENVLVLGRGGAAVLAFEPAIADGAGPDFVVFENAIHDTFLELAFVEVSSDGEHFVRFPNYSQTAGPVAAFGNVQPSFVHGLAGKYRVGYGVPFDLAELAAAHSAAQSGTGGFSEAYRAMLLANYPRLDPQAVRHVRVVDIVGDGSQRDSEGFVIYDPYPTVITAGFDLDAIGVLNQAQPGFAEWSAGHGLAPDAAADGDGDGWPQYLEYLCGSDPADPHSAPGMSLEPDHASGELVIRFPVNRLARGEPLLEVSHDTRDWRRVEHGAEAHAAAARGGAGAAVVTHVARIPANGSRAVLARLVAAPEG
jgi:hypothetical protein